MQRSPTVASELGLCVDEISSRTQKGFVGIDIQIASSLGLFLFRRYFGMKRLGPTLLVRLRETGSIN
jgi:hypothetical protein